MGSIVRNSWASAGMPVLFVLSTMYAQTDPGIQTLQLLPREKYSLTIPKISINIDDETRDFDGVRIIFTGSKDQVFIGTYDDMYIKNASHGSEKTLHRETPEKAGFLSKFEIKMLMKVNDGLVAELETLEKYLQKERWGRCCYLDAFFPHFLNGYFHLLYAARNSSSVLPRTARIPEDIYDISLSSSKTDARISQWRSSADHLIKLRIAGKELAYQIKEWQKMLGKAKDNVDIVSSRDFEDAFVIFIRVYFNMKPPSPVITKKPH